MAKPPTVLIVLSSGVVTPLPRPDRQDATEHATALVRFRAVGVPKAGAISVGEELSTTEPEPVVPSSPKTPALLYSTRPLVPPTTAVVPTVTVPAFMVPDIALAGIVVEALAALVPLPYR
jgi:hypothetical protein